jgi:succinate dehydrogenase / fumarate reductase flavoprotein subunit
MFNPGWHLTRDLKNMLLISEAVARSALARRESRGAHSRIDFPDYNPEWEKKNNIVANERGTMTLHQRPVPEMPADLKQLLEEKK